MKVYKIRNPEGLYSTGGNWPKFTKCGKSWSTLGHVKLHLNNGTGYGCSRKNVYKDCKVVVYELIEEEKESFDVYDILKD